jgi:hypothetical protein
MLRPSIRLACLTGTTLTALFGAASAEAQTAPTPTTSTPAATTPAATTTEAPAPTAAPAAAPAAPAAPAKWQDTISLSAQIDAGFTYNPGYPKDGLNFGQLFTDRANQLVMNQAAITLQRPLDPKATDYDVGFKIQALYGTDARYVQYLGEFNNLTKDRYTVALVEANVQVHLPWLTAGGIDLKAGQYATPLGFETIDPSTSPFYSHSYIFNFGLPFTHTGVLTVTHVNPMVDIYAGIDSGENTTLGTGDNNQYPAGLFGTNLTLLGGNLTILALTHLGPENDARAAPGAENGMRYENDLVATYKATPKLTLTTELNYIRDDFFKANGGGVAAYASYALTDQVALNGRAEIFRDDHGFFVAGFPNGPDYVKSQYGFPTAISGGNSTYSEFTVGFTWKPKVPSYIANLMVRPEVRYDDNLGGRKTFGSGKASSQFTAATDVILGF